MGASPARCEGVEAKGMRIARLLGGTLGAAAFGAKPFTPLFTVSYRSLESAMPSKSSGRLTALTAPRLSHGRAVVLLCRLAVGLSLPALAGTAFAGSVRGRIAGQEKLIPDVYVEASKSDAHRWTWR